MDDGLEAACDWVIGRLTRVGVVDILQIVCWAAGMCIGGVLQFEI